MGGATRFIALLTTPFPPLRPSVRFLRRCISTTPPRPLKIKPHTPQFISSFHSQPINHDNNTQSLHSTASQHHHHPWPEWSHFLNILSNSSEDHRIPPEDAFVVYEELPHHFTRAAASSLALARARPDLLGLLSRRDIEAVVSNGTPFLFKSALDTARRMRAFLGTDGSTVSEFDKATTVDLMKYILSYASNPSVSSERNGLYSREVVDSSVRNLLHELVTVSHGAQTGYMPRSDHQLSAKRGAYRPLGPNIEMKRGDWICPKCDFMNFAKNMKCLECEESRPKKQLTGGEWECPQCDFFNYGKNLVCLRCDCSKPDAPLFNNVNSTSSPGYKMDHSDKATINSRLAENKEKAQDWFSRISQLHNVNDINNAASKEDSSRIDQTSEMNNRKKTSSEVHETASSNIGNKENEQSEKSESWFKKMAELHDVKDLPSSVSDEDFPEIMPMRKGENRFVVSKKKDRSLTSPKYKRQVAMDEANNTNFVPFVPFPPGYFAKKETEQPTIPNSPVENSKSSEPTVSDTSTGPNYDNQPMGATNSQFPGEITTTPARSPVQNSTTSRTINSNSWTEKYSEKENTSQASSRLSENENVRSSWTGKSLEGSAVKEPDPLDMSEEAKAERWFKRVAQIKDISELSQIPDEDFPSIMPMRKGVNRFVVSKRKTPLERRLTSQQYRRNLPIVSTDSVKKEGDE
ncbi:hypothetical protein ACJIZ3_005495 [Penstemon smallii]|uniref:RanBP2-type domain-containing protein n=1 Tax=Penstemon smallii TaxID=265156 RepID=A0ABD3S518_9LAMI